MAWTVTTVDKTVYGNKRVHALKITTDSAEATVSTGLSYIDYITMAPQSVTTGVKIFLNVGSTATVTVGSLGCSGATSGDVFFLTVHGR